VLDCDGSAGEAGASLYQIQDAHAIASGFVDEISLDDWRNVFFSRFISLRLFFQSASHSHTLSRARELSKLFLRLFSAFCVCLSSKKSAENR
jgi:hypothetical protein